MRTRWIGLAGLALLLTGLTLTVAGPRAFPQAYWSRSMTGDMMAGMMTGTMMNAQPPVDSQAPVDQRFLEQMIAHHQQGMLMTQHMATGSVRAELRDLAERKPAARHEAKMHQVTVEEKIIELGRIISNVNFALFQGFYKTFQSRYELVVYILATLELAQPQRLHAVERVLALPLSPLQREIALFAGEGGLRRGCEQSIGVSEAALKKHLKAIYHAAGVESWEELARSMGGSVTLG